MDYYSDYFEIDSLSSKTGKVTISKLKKHFATHCIPNEVVSNNGPPPNSIEFANFLRSTVVKYVTSSPHHAQSNERIGNAVKTAKKLLKKRTESVTEYYLLLLNWRNTPIEGMNTSPAQRLRMFGHRTRTQLSTAEELLRPQTVAVDNIKEQLTLNWEEKQTFYYSQHVKELSPLKTG